MPINPYSIGNIETQSQNPFNGSNNALQMLSSALQTAFYPQAQQAEIASKQAYAKYAEPQLLASLISNPFVFASNPQAAQAISNKILGGLSGGMGNQQETPQYKPNQPNNSGNERPQPQVPFRSTTPPPAVPFNERLRQANADFGGSTFKVGESSEVAPSRPDINNPNVQPQNMQNQSGLPSTGNPFLDALFNKNYSTPQYEAYKTKTQEQAKNEADLWPKLLTDSFDSAKDANDITSNLNSFNEYYKKSNFKGPLGGLAPTTGLGAGLTKLGLNVFGTKEQKKSGLANEQLAEQMAANTQSAMAKLVAQGKVAVQELQFAGLMKPGRQLEPKAVQESVNFWNAKNKQLSDEPHFLYAAQQKGFDPQTAQALWKNYIQIRPIYDIKNKKINTKNIGNWRDFLGQDAANAVKNGQLYFTKNDLKNLTTEQLIEIKNRMDGVQ